MGTTYICTSVKELKGTVRRLRPDLFCPVERIHNIGGQFYDWPLLLFTERHVFRLFFSEGSLSLTVYERMLFEAYLEGDVFREPDGTDRIHPEACCPGAGICGLTAVKGCGTQRNLKGLDIIFSDGKRLCVRGSDLVYGTMDSWISDRPEL